MVLLKNWGRIAKNYMAKLSFGVLNAKLKNREFADMSKLNLT